jgi:hypothetical protein
MIISVSDLGSHEKSCFFKILQSPSYSEIGVDFFPKFILK